MNPWMQTFSGRKVDLIDPDPALIDFGDIALALSRLLRFNGATRFPYSVAQHCALGAKYLMDDGGAEARRRAFLFLLHDAHEAYIGDIATPVAQALCDPMRLHALKWRLDRAIWRAATGETWIGDKLIGDYVADIDLALLRAERDQLCAPPPESWGEATEAATPLPVLIFKIGVSDVRAWWLTLFKTLKEV